MAELDTARLKRQTHHWARWIHVYSSMIALLVVLFFALTGITLNHPQWTFGDDARTDTYSGVFPFDPVRDGAVDFLSMAEYVRSEYDVTGTVDSFEATSGQGSIAFKNPGYAADLFFDVGTGEYELTVEQQGFVAVMNDLHKGRDTSPLWRWVIDLSALFLVAISITGLTMQFFLSKRRRSAFISVGVGAVLIVALMVLTIT
ncbi:MAG: PepSY-associated TM helix domain-containing protein [Acidimicrobiales bacterium]|nr:PepSY-associated TM helix domain-containing protein [Acidimicrobiales bacterium]